MLNPVGDDRIHVYFYSEYLTFHGPLISLKERNKPINQFFSFQFMLFQRLLILGKQENLCSKKIWLFRINDAEGYGSII